MLIVYQSSVFLPIAEQVHVVLSSNIDSTNNEDVPVS